MGIVTKFLRLLKPEENDYYNSQTEQAENWEKVDNWAEELDKEIKKKASKTVLGRIIVGDNLTVDDNGKVSGNPPYTHPNGNGNSHLPSGGASGNFIKWLSAGVGQWTNITWSDITGKPSSFTPSSHTHTGGQITQDTTHRFVTDTEKVTWNGKLNKGSLPAKITDAKGLYDLLENNSGLSFDTNLLFLNDVGTKYPDKIYFDRNKKGLYLCIKQTTSTVNSTEYFVDISNYQLSHKLENLQKTKIIGKNLNYDSIGVKTLPISLDCSYKYIRIVTDNEKDTIFGYMQETIITYERKASAHMILGVTVNPMPTRNELITFSFPDDNTLKIDELTISGHNQLVIKEIEQFN